MSRFRTPLCLLGVLLLIGLAGTGCLNVKAPDEINIGGGHRHVDAASVPPTRDHAEARQKLAEAYEEIRTLQAKVRGLKDDKRELKEERDAYKDKYKRLKKRYDD